MAVEFCRVDLRVRDLQRELDPRRTVELLEEWERVTGLPDDCSISAMTIEERRGQVVQKLISRGGQNAAFFINVISGLGFNSSIDDFRQFRAGQGRAGDGIHGELWDFFFQVNSDPTETIFFRAGQGRAGDPIVEFKNEVLTCTIKKLKPAHTDVIFALGGA